MLRKPRSGDRELSHIIERQMRNWEIARAQKEEQAVPEEKGVKDYVAISRSVGLPGMDVAETLAQRLGWPVFVRQVLQAMAGADEYRRRLYEALDRRDQNWVEEFIRSMGFDGYSTDDFFRRLTNTILAIARKGNAIFLGRAADLILPKTAGLSVRLMAGKDYRVQSYAEITGLSLDEARRKVDEIETDRSDFVRRHFHRDVDDDLRFDLVIHMESFSIDQAVEMILAAMRLKGIVAETSA